MVDKEKRKRLRQILVMFYTGSITNTEMLDCISKAETSLYGLDRATTDIAKEVENIFEDTMCHTFFITDRGKEESMPFVARLIDFLDSDIEYDENYGKRRLKETYWDTFLYIVTLGLYGLISGSAAETPEEAWGSWPYPDAESKPVNHQNDERF